MSHFLLENDWSWIAGLGIIAIFFLHSAAKNLDKISDEISGLRRDISVYADNVEKHRASIAHELLAITGKLEEISGHAYSIERSQG